MSPRRRCCSHAELLCSSLTGTGERRGARAGSQVRVAGWPLSSLSSRGAGSWLPLALRTGKRHCDGSLLTMIWEPPSNFPRLPRCCEPPPASAPRQWAVQKQEGPDSVICHAPVADTVIPDPPPHRNGAPRGHAIRMQKKNADRTPDSPRLRVSFSIMKGKRVPPRLAATSHGSCTFRAYWGRLDVLRDHVSRVPEHLHITAPDQGEAV